MLQFTLYAYSKECTVESHICCVLSSHTVTPITSMVSRIVTVSCRCALSFPPHPDSQNILCYRHTRFEGCHHSHSQPNALCPYHGCWCVSWRVRHARIVHLLALHHSSATHTQTQMHAHTRKHMHTTSSSSIWHVNWIHWTGSVCYWHIHTRTTHTHTYHTHTTHTHTHTHTHTYTHTHTLAHYEVLLRCYTYMLSFIPDLMNRVILTKYLHDYGRVCGIVGVVIISTIFDPMESRTSLNSFPNWYIYNRFMVEKLKTWMLRYVGTCCRLYSRLVMTQDS